jgi:hypothetical protein
MNDPADIKALKHYVTESTRGTTLPKNTITIRQRVQNLLDKQEPLKKGIVVYRGHSEDAHFIRPDSWFSTSANERMVREHHIAEKATCCLFKINVMPGIRVLDVYKVLRAAGVNRTGFEDEEELIVDGSGVFLKGPDRSPGFREVTDESGLTIFETWYSVPKIAITSAQILERLTESEFEFIETSSELRDWPGLIGMDEHASNVVIKNAFTKMKNPKSSPKASNKNSKTQKSSEKD